MKKRYGKSIDSSYMKSKLNKKKSVEKAREFSTSIKGIGHIKQCPCCKSIKLNEEVTIYGFIYSECENCNLLLVVNQPSDEDIETMYNTLYYTDTMKTLYSNESIIDYRIDNIARPKFEYIDLIIKPTNKSWLDIGCGVGEILKVAKDNGYKVLGIETNKHEVSYAENKFGLEISSEYITKDSISLYKNYSVISMFGVLEHIPKIEEIIENISNIQTKDDYLVLDVPHYPSISSFSQMVFPNDVNRTMHPPLHLYLFNLKSLEILLKRFGYEITNTWYYGQDIYEFISTLELHHSNLSSSKLKDKLLNLTNELQFVIDKSELSDEILVVAKKCT